MIEKEADPFAQESISMRKTRLGRIEQDGDMWFETVFRNYINGRKRIFFVSYKTGVRCRDEPPTGASVVVYLKSSVRKMRMHQG